MCRLEPDNHGRRHLLLPLLRAKRDGSNAKFSLGPVRLVYARGMRPHELNDIEKGILN